MPVSHPHRAIFVHVPKTAGTSVEALLGMHGEKTQIGLVPYFNQELDLEHLYGRQLQHLTALQIREALRDDVAFATYFKFAIVRNPWERLVSALAWTDQKWARGEELVQRDFEQQVLQVQTLFQAAQAAPASVALPHFLTPQCLYLYDAEQRLMVDEVLRFERLDEEWPRVARRLGVADRLPIRMKSHHRHYRDYYNEHTRRVVAGIYASDARLLGYEF